MVLVLDLHKAQQAGNNAMKRQIISVLLIINSRYLVTKIGNNLHNRYAGYLPFVYFNR